MAKKKADEAPPKTGPDETLERNKLYPVAPDGEHYQGVFDQDGEATRAPGYRGGSEEQRRLIRIAEEWWAENCRPDVNQPALNAGGARLYAAAYGGDDAWADALMRLMEAMVEAMNRLIPDHPEFDFITQLSVRHGEVSLHTQHKAWRDAIAEAEKQDLTARGTVRKNRRETRELVQLFARIDKGLKQRFDELVAEKDGATLAKELEAAMAKHLASEQGAPTP